MDPPFNKVRVVIGLAQGLKTLSRLVMGYVMVFIILQAVGENT